MTKRIVWDKVRLQDQKIRRCTICGEWTWMGKCTVDHKLLTERDAA